MVCWAHRGGRRDLPCQGWAALVSPLHNFFRHHTLLHFICPHRLASWALGRESCNVACVLICVSGHDALVVSLFTWRYLTTGLAINTVNNFELMYSRQRISKNSFKVYLYISKVIYDIPARTTSVDAAVSLWRNIIPKGIMKQI